MSRQNVRVEGGASLREAAKYETIFRQSDLLPRHRHANHALAVVGLIQPLDRLRRRHDAFQNMLRMNLTVLATAHAVSEGIIRGVSGELARKQAPSTYSASGRAQAPSTKATQPLALSRTL